MLRFVPRRLAIGAYSMFMIEQRNNPKLKGLAVADRGKMTSKMYKALSANEKAALD
ncbi:putative kinetoplast-associated protein [Leishmania braziliensis MHOM/BR/75/M2904]|uniref:Kinetoplast-associated protein n=1 Tax=Leishmania braziliensis TaxID=5660 RepID=A4HQA2_LEIBR|nr:putative kinetoplast-associated protein [Leishmania braziliensis MHOM/BR/75/M2904]CAM44367.1 putative kinetoplast-associated protein [Leishmania braziliensis MHOM/BR/75/M2904]